MKRNIEIPQWFIGLLTAWAIWVSKGMVTLQNEVAVLKYKNFNTVTQKEPDKKYNLDADMNFLQFLERKKQ